MASNSFGQIFRITTFGESHGPAVGVVIDGCPAGLSLTVEDIDLELSFRRPGNSDYTSQRAEKDHAEILSGLFEGKTTGAPITIMIRNEDSDSSQYEAVKDLYRPGHGNFTYLKKYGLFDHRGGGRSSARETAGRVAAGAVAKKLLAHFHIDCVAYIAEIGSIPIGKQDFTDLDQLREKTRLSPIFCPDGQASAQMVQKIEAVKEEGDSLGGIVGCLAHLPAGLGEPIYGKLEAELAHAMLSLPASKGFEIGSGFGAARQRGSTHNDSFEVDEQGEVCLSSNHCGGTLGGISTGSPLFFRVAFKPTSSIKKAQKTVNLKGERATFEFADTRRHDPCVAIRAVSVVEAMTALVLADGFLKNRSAKLGL